MYLNSLLWFDLPPTCELYCIFIKYLFVWRFSHGCRCKQQTMLGILKYSQQTIFRTCYISCVVDISELWEWDMVAPNSALRYERHEVVMPAMRINYQIGANIEISVICRNLNLLFESISFVSFLFLIPCIVIYNFLLKIYFTKF